MGTVSNSLTSTASTPTTVSSSTSSMFNGTSQYSQDFQNVITRAVAIASLPVTLLTNQQTTLTNQSNELSTVDTKFTALQTAVQGIQDALNGSSFNTDISDPTVVSASVADGAQQGNYSIQVISPGAYETSLTTSTWVSTGAAAKYTLMVGGQPHPISATDDSAATVAATINAQYGNLVNATVVNVGSSTTPDYRISLQSATLGPVNVDIQDASGDGLQTQQNAQEASLASYEVDGSGVTVTSDTPSVSIATGLTLNLLATGTTNVTVTRSTSALSSALSSFADAYNAAATEVAAQRGQSAGPLQGQSIVFDLSQALSAMGIYNSSSGQVTNLEQLGLDLGVNGQFTYNALTMMGTDLTNSADVTAFLGSATGGGFLQVATNALNNLEDPTTGVVKTTEANLTSQITDIGTQISTKQTQVDQLQTNMENQMTQADAMIASMEQQYTYITDMFQAEQTAALQYANE
jgi:flagellar hook-associated protein 2